MYGMHPPKSTKPNVKVRALTIAEQQRLWDALQTKKENQNEVYGLRVQSIDQRRF